MSDSEEDWDEIEKEGDDQKCSCPFCEEVQPSPDDTLEHCHTKHDINLLKHKQSLRLDFYGWIKLINYIRKEHPTVQDLVLAATNGPPFPWSDDLFLQPVIPDDALLQLDFDEDEEMREGMEKIIIVDTEKRDDTVMEELKKKLKETELKLMESERRLRDAYQDMNNMRHAVSNIISEGTEQIVSSRKEGLEKEEEEDGYFSTYSHYSIHEEMLKDEVRMESYHLFISRNTDLFKDKVVLDVGCGTGILSIFAVKSGASHVIAIDRSEIIYKAMEIARENNVSESITFIRGCVEEVVLPVDKVDIIISEWMGYMLLFESMMDTVLFARDKWLKDHRHVYPNNCSISLVAMGDEYEYQNNVGFWDDIKGYKMSCMRSEVLKEAKVIIVDEYSLISSADVIKKFNLSTVQSADLQFESNFSLAMLHTTVCHGIVAYFDIGFEVSTYRVYFSTSPQDTPTHWKQTVLFLKEPLKVQTGDMLRGIIKCSRDSTDHRCMTIQLTMELTSFHKDDTGQTIEPITLKQSYSLC